MMKNPTRTAASLFACGLAIASQASADVTEGWGYTNAPINVPTNIEAAIMNLTNYILGFVSIIATLVIIYGGILYLTALGNDETVAKARKTISSGIIGLVICGLAYAVVSIIKTTLSSP